jgi:predicted nucleic acid-binding protein
MTGISTNPKVVPDASIILKWVLPQENEPYSKQAHAISQAFYDNEIDLILPSLWVYEVGNVLTLKYPEVAGALLAHLANLDIPVVQPSARLIELTAKLVTRHSVTFYDASYHALAVTAGAFFVTADEKFLRKVPGDKYCQHIRDW